MRVGSKLQFEIPDECPNNCEHQGSPIDKGDPCCRCPIFNCKAVPYRLVEPKNYRDDMAHVWETYFNAIVPKSMEGFE